MVSFNKVRLQYYVSKKSKRAQWLSYLLDHPARLFGTTLIGVNAMMQMGSEMARRFYLSVGISPDWAALTQTILVLIFAELSPMLAARRYAEHVSMLGAPIIFLCSIIMTPFIWCFNILCRLVQFFTGKSDQGFNYLTREELQRAIEEKEEGEGDTVFDQVAQNILQLKQKQVSDLMVPIDKVATEMADANVASVRENFSRSGSTFLPLYHISKFNIIGMAYAKSLIRSSDEESVRSTMIQPWFVPETTPVNEVLRQFRYAGQHVAIVLDREGLARGILRLDDIIRDLFGTNVGQFDRLHISPILIERTFPSNAKIVDINRKLGIAIEEGDAETLEELMIAKLGHRPTEGESVRVGAFDLIMQEAGLFKGKRIIIQSK